MFEGVLRLAGAVLVIWSATALAGPELPSTPSRAKGDGGPAGRVVRVVRAGGKAQVAPRLCEIRGDGGTCVGDEPRRGEVVMVLDDRHVIAEVQILESRLYAPGCQTLWTVKTRALHGATADGDGIGVIDPAVNPIRAHTLDKNHRPRTPSGQPGEDVWQAIDRDGDGTADILSTRYSCDPSGKPVAGAPAYCIDIWARPGSTGGPDGPGGPGVAKMTRTSQLNFAQCNI
jgi:hypothetical protein